MSKKETKNITELVRKPELYLGIATLIVAGILIVKATYKPMVKVAQRIVPTITITPSPSISPTQAGEKIQAVAQKTEVKKDIKQIKKFADTGEVKVWVKEGDNFWKIAEQVCGNGIFADSIKEQNGYAGQSLQPGNVLVISCD